MRRPFQILLLCVLVSIIFYPALNAEVCLVDDQLMLSDMFNAGSVSIKEVFLPRISNGGYYRPFIGLSYYLDKTIWDLDVRSMHLDNIVMHLINVLLVFWIMGIAMPARKGFQSWFPLCAAALFALHPIVTESVNWISGRTDLMAANFVLASAVLLLFYRSTSLKRYLVAAIWAILLGIFSKEASFGMVLATCFILGAKDTSGTTVDADNRPVNRCNSPFTPSGLPFLLVVFAFIAVEVLYIGNYWFALAGCGVYSVSLLIERMRHTESSRFSIKNLVLLSGYLLVTVSLYALSRKLAFQSDVGKIGQTIKLMALDINYSISVFLGASGFYFKKFLFPLPLNFYILEVDPLYDLAGIFLLLFCLRLLSRLDVAAGFFIAGVCMFLPALPFAFGTIAWTGYAERYIYISTAFWIISLVMYLDAHPPRKPWTIGISVGIASALMLLFGWQTHARNLVWQKNISLLENTVRQTPTSKILREIYMYAFYQADRIDDAKEQYAVANSLHSLKYDGIADRTMASILTKEGKLYEALALYEMAVKKDNNASDTPVKQVIRHLEIMLDKEKNAVQRKLLSDKIRTYETMLSDRSTDPMVYYNLGQKALAANDKRAALAYFVRANRVFGNANPYKRFSGKLIERLKRDTF